MAQRISKRISIKCASNTTRSDWNVSRYEGSAPGCHLFRLSADERIVLSVVQADSSIAHIPIIQVCYDVKSSFWLSFRTMLQYCAHPYRRCVQWCGNTTVYLLSERFRDIIAHICVARSLIASSTFLSSSALFVIQHGYADFPTPHFFHNLPSYPSPHSSYNPNMLVYQDTHDQVTSISLGTGSQHQFESLEDLRHFYKSSPGDGRALAAGLTSRLTTEVPSMYLLIAF